MNVAHCLHAISGLLNFPELILRKRGFCFCKMTRATLSTWGAVHFQHHPHPPPPKNDKMLQSKPIPRDRVGGTNNSWFSPISESRFQIVDDTQCIQTFWGASQIPVPWYINTPSTTAISQGSTHPVGQVTEMLCNARICLGFT